ncbi:cupin domain-containing protein [Dyadobacter diqingensis]|uniref:cupin domain-containing protein n=1 Tax=Dyadobacter diqingensis TaxID=2938121 RepID=UPI0020C1F36D|nr:cupin domain-containing protein [Dyadobacter diqingensis]
MKRKAFLKMSFGAIPALSGAAIQGKSWQPDRSKKGFKVDVGRDRFDQSISLLEGDTFFTKISQRDTGGDVYLFESTRLKKGGPSFHFHYDQDEWWYILTGAFTIKVGDDIFQAKAGDSVFGPRGVPHTFSKTSEGEAKMLILFQPAGKMEEFFQAVSKGALAKMSELEQDNFRKQHGFEKVGPALEYMKKF